nr:LpqB family beta-propeller domain-containing protein [Microbacterium amylolyticum]
MLAACAGLPTAGYVQPGNQTGTAQADAVWQFTPDGPSEDASPAEIVLGFLEAGESPTGNWDIAREFLTDDFAAEWRPESQVTVENISDRTIADFVGDAEEIADAGSGELRVSVTPTAFVGEDGQYVPASGGARALNFQLVRDDAGQWRVSAAPDGVVVASGRFDYIFSEHVLYFFAVGSARLVPDMRWFPNTTGMASRIARTLVDGGPSDWLDGAVTTAFDGVNMGRQSVPLADDGMATVDLSGLVRERSDLDRGRMLVQLQSSLASAGVHAVQITVDDQPLRIPEITVDYAQPDARALVMTHDEFGFLGRETDRIPGLSDVIETRFTAEASEDDAATSITVAGDHSHAAVQSEDGTVWRVRDDGTLDDLVYGSEWVAPALDPFGFIWSVPEERSSALQAWGDDGEPISIAGLDELSEIDDIRMARDGARLAIAGAIDDRPVLFVAGITRAPDGTPIELAGVLEATALPERADVIAWVADTTVAVAIPGDNRTIVIEQTIGGRSERLTASFAITMMTYGNPQSNERMLTRDGELFVRKITTWQQAGEGVSLLATQLGSPAP